MLVKPYVLYEPFSIFPHWGLHQNHQINKSRVSISFLDSDLGVKYENRSRCNPFL